MERYSEYKDSGVQWLGEIPGHWGCVPLKRICEMKSGNNLTSLDILDKGEFPVYGANGFRGYYNQYNKEGKYILIGRQGALAGNVHLVDGKFWATDHAVVTNITSDKVFVDYISLALISMNLNQYAFDTAAQPGLAVSKIISFSTPLPPLSEQHSIVSFLDDKCGKIDKILEGKQKQIELLAEMKQRIIADAVTRGLNPDVKLKATNIPWLPEIPEHWEFTRNKTLLKLTDEKVGGRKDITLLSLTKQGVIIRDLSEGKGKFPKDFDSYLVVRPNNLVFCLFDIDETPRTVGLVRNYGMLTGAYTNFEVNESLVLPEYIYNYYLQVDNIKGLRPYYTGLRKVVKTGSFLQIRMPLPPLDEQRAIVSYITGKTTKLDTLTSKLQQEIESIKEYKLRLISDVVTGQIKVC